MKNKILFIGFATFLILLTAIFTEGLNNKTFGQWFSTNQSALLHSTEQKGNVSIVRRGTGYVLMEDVGLIDGDRVITSYDSAATLESKNQFVAYFDENTQAQVESLNESICLELLNGGFFLRTQDTESAQIYFSFKDTLCSVGRDTVVSAEIFEGTQTIKVYKGCAEVNFNGETQIISVGEEAILLEDEDDNATISYARINPIWLSTFLINGLTEQDGVCFEAEELSEILSVRQAETAAAQKAQAEHEAEILAHGGTIAVISHDQSDEAADEKKSAMSEDVSICTIQIRCDTILNNTEDLIEGKEDDVPKNGMILNTSNVEFVEGESVYDVLKRVCEYCGIQLEYEWTVKYGGYYIKGINKLYEFDCGSGSGWMYKVNGWYPNYSCSDYILKEGDIIVWNYTCDLGKDLGAEVH